MLSTSIGVQFNVNDLDASYEVVGTSDNYSFQYNLGRGSDLVDFEGESLQKIISLEGNYGTFDVRVFAVSEIGVRSEFIESTISISAPEFEDTFTFGSITIDNLPANANVGAFNSYEPQSPGDKLEVQCEYIGRNLEISWQLVPPQGHYLEGQLVSTELLKDAFFDRFELVFENGTGSQIIPSETIATSAAMEQTLLTADVAGLLADYRDFSISINQAAFNDIDFDRTLALKIISYDSFGRTATGLISGRNYEPQVEGLSYALRGSDMSFSWFVNDTDFSGVNITSLAIPSDQDLIYANDIESSINYYEELNAAQSWNLGFGEYRSGDMAYYQNEVYQAKENITLSLIDQTGRLNTNPTNIDLWNKIGPKINYTARDLEVFENTSSTTQVWGYSYYYALRARDGYGPSSLKNLTEAGLVEGGELRPFTSEVKIGSIRYREREDDLIFNWEIVDQDGNLVDLDQYKFALTTSDTPSILGVSGSLFDSHTKKFLTGITEGKTSKISSVDELGNRTIVYDLPNTKVFDTYEFTREINNQIYGTGGFVTNFEVFDTGSPYYVDDYVADYDERLYKCITDTSGYNAQVSGYNPTIRPSYKIWSSSETYRENDVFEYVGDLYKVVDQFGPESPDVLGVFNSSSDYQEGDLVISPDLNILPYFTNQEYLAGDIVIYNQTLYLSLRYQAKEEDYRPNTAKTYWRVLSLFEDIPCSIYKAIKDIDVNAPFSINKSGEVGDEHIEGGFYYFCFEQNNWGRVPLVYVSRDEGNPLDKAYDNDYFYVCIGGATWGKILLFDSNKQVDGDELLFQLEADHHFVQIYVQSGWKKFALSHWSYNGYIPSVDISHWVRQTPSVSSLCEFYVPKYPLAVSNWSENNNYEASNLVVYANDIWSGTFENGPAYNAPQAPYSGSPFWASLDSQGNDILVDISSGNLTYHNGSIYFAKNDNPKGAPINAQTNSEQLINSTYTGSEWVPFWEQDTSYDGFVYGHIGIPESGKRSVGLEVGIIDNTGSILSSQRLIAINQEPSIRAEGFQVDSLSETTKVKFNFNYAFQSQEKTTKVNLYRSNTPYFDITGADGLPYDVISGDSTLVKVTLGAADATFGDNITQIIDSPPIPNVDGIDEITGYYYKILPFDAFGSGDLYNVSNNQGLLEQILVYPKNYSNKNPNGVPGPVFRTSADDIPGVVVDFTGNTAFRNYFLNWSHPSGNINDVDNIPNDLSHYEVWMSEEENLELGSLGSEIFLKEQADQNQDVDFSNASGYRRIKGNIPNYLSGLAPIDITQQDPASGIINAEKIFNVAANGSEVEASYFGETNDTKYFWVRAVDFAGNKGPFSNSSSDDIVKGLKLSLGQASATDIDDFELNITESFGNTIALVPNNPFFTEFDQGQQEYVLNWQAHALYHQGTGYWIEASGIGGNWQNDNVKYIWWDKSEKKNFSESEYPSSTKRIHYSGIDYKVTDFHPAGSDGNSGDARFGDGDFIVAKVGENLSAVPVYHAFANALIGTASIADAAIIDAKIENLTADKITAGEIKGHEIIVGTQGGPGDTNYGSIATPGFDGYKNYPKTNKGFKLEGDGSFEFRGINGGLSLDPDDGVLSLSGRLFQSDGTPYDFIDLNASPSYFNYIENNNGGFELQDTDPIKIVASFRNSAVQEQDVLFRMDAIIDQPGINERFSQVFSYQQWENSLNNGQYSLSGLSYSLNPVDNQFEISGAIRHATAFFDPGDGVDQGFDDIISSFDASSIVIYCSGRNGNYESTVNIGRIIDGRQGTDGSSPTYRGEWDPTKTYYKQSERADIVRYSALTSPTYGPYFIAAQTHTNQPPLLNVAGSVQLNQSYWSDFGATFSSVATQLLITEQSVVTDKIEIGEPNAGGIIYSNGFRGSLYDAQTDIDYPYDYPTFNNGAGLGHPGDLSNAYSVPGFFLGRPDSGAAYFDIGGPVKDLSGNNITYDFEDSSGNSYLGLNVVSYMRFNSKNGKLEIKGSFTNNTSNEDVDAVLSSYVFAGSNGFADSGFSVNDTLATFVGGGYDNIIFTPDTSNSYMSLASSIVGGGQNQIVGRFSMIGNGYNNSCADNFSFIGGGYNNSMSKYTELNEGANFIGAGQNNTIYGGTNQSIIGGSNNKIQN